MAERRRTGEPVRTGASEDAYSSVQKSGAALMSSQEKRDMKPAHPTVRSLLPVRRFFWNWSGTGAGPGLRLDRELVRYQDRAGKGGKRLQKDGELLIQTSLGDYNKVIKEDMRTGSGFWIRTGSGLWLLVVDPDSSLWLLVECFSPPASSIWTL